MTGATGGLGWRHCLHVATRGGCRCGPISGTRQVKRSTRCRAAWASGFIQLIANLGDKEASKGLFPPQSGHGRA